MRILTCLLPLAAVAAAPVDAPPKPCPTTQLSPADQHKPVTAHPLNREPGAKLEIAVQRTDADGCVRPIVVRDNVGGKSR
ncbi:MAG TPA: hypothetical protein VFT56_13030 [Sphingomonas sp.]|nr:hypothetical protein [Sphingomonas sp.]